MIQNTCSNGIMVT